jgi:hypothetical protein
MPNTRLQTFQPIVNPYDLLNMGCTQSKSKPNLNKSLPSLGHPSSHWSCRNNHRVEYLTQRQAGTRFPDCRLCGAHMAAPNGGGEDMVWICWHYRTYIQAQRETPPKDIVSCQLRMTRVPPGDIFLKKLQDIEAERF